MATGSTLAPVTLDVLAATPRVFRALLGGLPEAVAARLRDGDWSARDVLAHVLDRGPTLRQRVELMVAEPHPPIPDVDEAESLEASGYRRLPVAELLDRFERERAADVERYAALTAVELARAGQHSVAGPISVAELLNHVAHHDLNHLQQVAAILAAPAHEGRGAMQRF